MARRRKGLGAPPEVHAEKLREADAVFRHELAMATRSLKAGDCQAAVESLMYATFSGGQAHAQWESGPPSRSQSTRDRSKAIRAAFKKFGSRCVVKR